MRKLVTVALFATCALAAPALAQLGPITITGTVATNTLQVGRFAGALPGDPVTMTFRTLPGGFNAPWGPSTRFTPVDEASYEIRIGAGASPNTCFSAANNNALIMIGSGFVTTAVHQDEMEFFQMALDSSIYRVYFKTIDFDDTVWTSSLVGELPHRTPNAPFDFKRWEIVDLFNPNMTSPGPILTINFDGEITVPCRADTNGDQNVSVQDIFDFLADYFSSSLDADINGDGQVSIQDIFDFLVLYFRGC